MVETRSKKNTEEVYEKFEDKLAKRRAKTDGNTLIKEEILAPEVDDDKQVIIQFKDADEKEVGAQLSVPANASKADLNVMLATFLEEQKKETDEFQIYQFYLEDREIKASV